MQETELCDAAADAGEKTLKGLWQYSEPEGHFDVEYKNGIVFNGHLSKHVHLDKPTGEDGCV